MSNPTPRFPPRLAMIVAILAVSTAAIFIRYAQRDAPSLTIAAYRMSLSALLLLPFALRQGRAGWLGFGRRDLRLSLLAGVFLALHFALWIQSLELTTVTSSVVLVTTTPLWVAIFSPLFLKERMPPAALAGLALALAGGVVVALADACAWQGGGLRCQAGGFGLGGQALWGDFLALAGAWMAAAYLMIGRGVRARLGLAQYTSLVYGSAALALLLACWVLDSPLGGFPPAAYLWLAALAVIPQGIGHTLYNWGLRYLPVSQVSVTLLGEPVGSSVLALFLLGEAPSALKIAGGILILIGIALTTREG